MSSTSSDIVVNPRPFAQSVISDEIHAFNDKLMGMMKGAPKWYEVGAEKYRDMRAKGQTPLPPAVLLDTAENYSIPSRDSGREIPCRILRPTNGKSVRAVYMHIHGGGWVLQNEYSQDGSLQDIANTNGVLMISIGYRLAPEHPYPAGPNDCYDAAEWLIDNAQAKLGATLAFVGGESAGAHLSMCIALHLLQHQEARYRGFSFKALLLHFGCYDLTFTPSTYLFQKPEVLILDKDLMEHYVDVFCPGMTVDQKRDPKISPLYANLEKLRGRLPPALFTCGTEDCLLDDTIFMSAKYQAAGAESEVLIIPGAVHGYIMFPRDTKESQSEVGLTAVERFIKKQLG